MFVTIPKSRQWLWISGRVRSGSYDANLVRVQAVNGDVLFQVQLCLGLPLLLHHCSRSDQFKLAALAGFLGVAFSTAAVAVATAAVAFPTAGASTLSTPGTSSRAVASTARMLAGHRRRHRGQPKVLL